MVESRWGSDKAAYKMWAAVVSALLTPLRQRAYNMSLLARLLVAEAVVFAFVFVGGTYLINTMADSLRDNIRHERLLLGRAIAEDLDASVTHSVDDLRALAAACPGVVMARAPAECLQMLEILAKQSDMFTRGILVVGSDGRALVAGPPHPSLAQMDLRQYWPGLWDQGEGVPGVQIMAFVVEGQAGPTVAVAVPIPGGADGDFAVGLIDTLSSYPRDIVARATRLGESGHADIIDEKGVALFSLETQHLLVTSDHPTCYQALFQRGEPIIAECGHEEAGAVDGEPHLMAFVPLKAVPWAAVSGSRVSEAFAPVRQLWASGLGILALLGLLAFTATVFVSRILVAPVKALSKAARRVADGERASAVLIPWGGEIGDLARSLETMRLRLHAWGSELEKQVQERTFALEERNRELSALYDTLQQKERHLRLVLEKVLGAQEDERKRVSRELHDGIGQALSALSMGLERLEQATPEQQVRLQDDVQGLKELASDTLRDLRRLTIALRPAALEDLGLVPAIRRYAELLFDGTRVDFQLSMEGLSRRLEPSLETVVYRVVQEAMNNVARHSEASQARVHLQSTDDRLVATVEDNGKGFDLALASLRKGVGLQGMEERASLLGGRLTVESQPGRGAKVRLEIPLSERAKTLPHA